MARQEFYQGRPEERAQLSVRRDGSSARDSVFDWTSHFLQAFANEAEGMEFEPLRQAVLPNVYDKTLGDPMLDRDDR
jgi:hypothetical protein